MVILNKITKGALKNFSNFKSVDVYYNHGLKGKNILLREQKKNLSSNLYNDEFLNAIENHHKNTNDKIFNNNILLKILLEADNIN